MLPVFLPPNNLIRANNVIYFIRTQDHFKIIGFSSLRIIRVSFFFILQLDKALGVRFCFTLDPNLFIHGEVDENNLLKEAIKL